MMMGRDSADGSVPPALTRVRSHFHQCPVVYDDDPLAPPQPVFPITDFIASVSSSVVEDIAESFLAAREFDTPDVIMGVANRSVGCIIHELARRTELPYTLANWYPKGSAGETLVANATGFGGVGCVYVNGLRAGDRIVLVIDILRTGKNLEDLLRACHKAHCIVVGIYCVCEVMEYSGRETVRGFLDPVTCPLQVLVQVSARGERTKVVGTEGAQLYPTPPRTAAISRLCVEDVMMSQGSVVAMNNARNLLHQQATVALHHVPLTREAINAKLKRVAEPFFNIPVVHNPNLKYPYCFFQLTDFVPLMTYDAIEDMAELCVRHANFNRCDVIVSEADRGGAPLAVALSRRTGKPFVLASWSTHVDSQISDSTSVGFSGEGRFFVGGVKNGERCIFVDDMLSSGGTAEGIIGALHACGAVTLEAIFVSEKLQAPKNETEQRNCSGYADDDESVGLPRRGGYKRLTSAYPDLQVSTLVQFTAYGPKTEPPVATVG